ncbi:M24 family metallopeptidase [Alteribacillus iranensis]|uniref:Xaa-Pro dipeptidase n=1 Tax=Alteribacillus iranensis TaxID=930128 RepID=A0A1I2B6S4_9BACI|nr:Xaa-Pro peptidase family protein [Alteribacillus iranensis]SFE51851.1 Xaa-Pro dipeptidase [Alteribacillus iranensis]
MVSEIIHKDLPFELVEYQNRLKKLKKEMASEGVDYLLVNDPVDLNYLLGYRSWGFTFLDWQVLIISLDYEPILVTRKLESTNFKYQTWIENMVTFSDEEDPMDRTIEVLTQRGVVNKRIALSFHSWFINANQFLALKDKLPNDVEIVDGTNITIKCRLIKSSREVTYIRQAADITSKVMNQIKEISNVYPTENDIAQRIMNDLISSGSEFPATPPFIGVGKRSTYGHPTWENYKTSKGDVVFLEFSGCTYRYHAPIMRTLSIGEPSNQAKRFEETSRGVINTIIDSIQPGMKVEDIDRICKEYLSSKNMNQYFHNRIGYSVGIGFTKWMDGMSIKKGVDMELQENMVFHIIPFITDFEISVAISETILINKNGAEKLTNAPQEIFVLDNE